MTSKHYIPHNKNPFWPKKLLVSTLKYLIRQYLLVHQSTFLSFLTASPAGQSRCCLTPLGLPALLNTPVCYQRGQSQPGLYLPRPLSSRAPGLSPTSGSTQLNRACREAALPPQCISMELSSSVLLGSPEQQQASESKLASHVCPELSNRKWYFTFFFFFFKHHPLSWHTRHYLFQPCSGDTDGHCSLCKNRTKMRSCQDRNRGFCHFFFFLMVQ